MSRNSERLRRFVYLTRPQARLLEPFLRTLVDEQQKRLGFDSPIYAAVNHAWQAFRDKKDTDSKWKQFYFTTNKEHARIALRTAERACETLIEEGGRLGYEFTQLRAGPRLLKFDEYNEKCKQLAMMREITCRLSLQAETEDPGE